MKQRLFLLLLFIPLFLGLSFVWLRYFTCILLNPVKAWSIAREVDVLANVAGNGKPDTTISSRAARAQVAGRRWGCVLCRFLDLFQKDHCKLSLEKNV